MKSVEQIATAAAVAAARTATPVAGSAGNGEIAKILQKEGAVWVEYSIHYQCYVLLLAATRQVWQSDPDVEGGSLVPAWGQGIHGFAEEVFALL